MPTRSKTRATAHAQRTLTRELKHLLKAAHILADDSTAHRGNTGSKRSGRARKTDKEHVLRIQRAWRVRSALSRAAGALLRIQERLPNTHLGRFSELPSP